jgi:flagellar biosynthetic protein FliR
MVMVLDPAWGVAVFMLWIRLSVLFVMSPIFAGMNNMVVMRALFTLALAAVLVPMSGQVAPVELSSASWIPAILGELVLGGVLAFGVFAAFGAFAVAGKIIDVQSGFGIGSVFDPVTRAESPLFATMLNLGAVAVFFAINGHHALLRGMAFSIQQVSPGVGLSALPADAMLRQFGLMFSLGVSLIAPVMFCLFLVEACLAFTSRVLPQMNVFVVGVPVKIVAGLLAFAMTMGSLGQVMSRIYGAIFTFWEQVLR